MKIFFARICPSAVIAAIFVGLLGICTQASAQALLPQAARTAVWVLCALLLLALAGMVVARTQRHRSLHDIARGFRLLPEHFDVQRPADPLAAIEQELDRYGKALDALRARRQQELIGRVNAEARLRQLEERYGMAIRGADEALWEWHLRSDRVYFSPRWKSVLGYPEDEWIACIDQWTERIHPDDHDGFMQAIRAHLEGVSTRLEHEHRVRHRDGSWVWVAVRASLVRSSAGEPARIVGLMSEVTARRRIQQAVIDVAEGLSSATGDECLRKLVRSFAAVLGVREAFVCECSDVPTTRVRMLARWRGGDFARCVEFDVAGTACEDVVSEGRTVFVPREADRIWPLEAQFERHSYLGLPCCDSSGRVIGHLACADDKPMREELPHHAVLKIYAMRAAIELERAALVRLRDEVYPDPRAASAA